MAKYHINPETGNPGICKAAIKCRFGSIEHFDSKEAARLSFEKSSKIKEKLSYKINSNLNPGIEEIFPLELLIKDIEAGFVSIREHEADPALKILCYTKNTQYSGHWNDVTKSARGLIIRSAEEDFSDAIVLERPWRKFFTLQQVNDRWSLGDEEASGSAFNEIELLDFNQPAEVTDKSDGSLGIMYIHPDGLPAFATKGSFHSEQAEYYTKILRNNKKQLEEAQALLYDQPEKTHLFELVGPNNQIVCDYKEDDMILLGSVSKKEGLYHSASDQKGNWSGGIVEVFEAKNLTEALSIPDREGREGLVIRAISNDPNRQLQIKVKQEDYLRLHRILSNFSLKDMRKDLSESTSTIDDLIKVHQTKNVEHIKGLENILNIDINHPAIDDAISKRRAALEQVILPRAEKLSKAKNYVDKLSSDSFKGENPKKRFVESVKNLEGYELSDLISFYDSRLNDSEVKTFKIFRNLSKELKVNNLEFNEG